MAAPILAFIVVVALVAGAGFCMVFGAYALINLRRTKTEIRTKYGIIRTQSTAIVLFLFGVILLLAAFLFVYQKVEISRLETTVSTQLSELAMLRDGHRALVAQNEELDQLRSDLSAVLDTSNKIPARVDERVTSALGKAFKDTPTSGDILALRTEIQELREQQQSFRAIQEAVTKQLAETSTLLHGQSVQFNAVQARLARIDIQDRVAQVIADALPSEFAPVRWQMAEIKKGKRTGRVYELTAESLLIETKDYSLRPEFEGGSFVLTAAVKNDKTRAKILKWLPVKKITAMVEQAGFKFALSFVDKR